MVKNFVKWQIKHGFIKIQNVNNIRNNSIKVRHSISISLLYIVKSNKDIVLYTIQICYVGRFQAAER